jgi:hypothetical protein
MMSDYTVAAISYVLMAGFLVSVLLIGGLLVLNLGLLSKRDRDLIGGRNPSDVGILKNSNWPQVPEDQPILPAMEEQRVGSADYDGSGEARDDAASADKDPSKKRVA